MSFVRISPATEYNPYTNTLRQNGEIREAGMFGMIFSALPEVQKQVRADTGVQYGGTAEAGSALRPSASGISEVYTGPASLSPYYVTAGDPLRDGRVKEMDRWLASAGVRVDSIPGCGGHTIQVTTEEGAIEALRLVRTYVPEAQLESYVFGEAGGPWRADKPSHYVVLPDGSRLNAAAVIMSYYNQGMGVTSLSDFGLKAMVTPPGKELESA